MANGQVDREVGPRDVPDLFVRFANSIRSPEETRRFMAAYGVPLLAHEVRPGTEYPGECARSISMHSYVWHAAVLALLLKLHRASRDEDVATIRKWKEDLESLVIAFRKQAAPFGPENAAAQDRMIRDMVARNPLAAAETAISDALTYFLSSLPGAHATPMAFIYSRDTELAIYAPGFTFTDTIYWQFAASIQRGEAVGVCEGCGRLFLRTRRDKRRCDEACGARVRMRRKRARDRADENASRKSARA